VFYVLQFDEQSSNNGRVYGFNYIDFFIRML